MFKLQTQTTADEIVTTATDSAADVTMYIDDFFPNVILQEANVNQISVSTMAKYMPLKCIKNQHFFLKC